MFHERLSELSDQLTPTERQLAAYITANLETIVFETGASLAAKSGVSPNTVSRFLRRFGYKGLKSLKEELRDDLRVQSLLSQTLLDRIEANGDGLAENLNQEIEALAAFYEQAGTEQWREIVEVVSGAERVFVCGFQTVRGLAEDFANRLALVRSDVNFLDLYGGVLGPWLDRRAGRSCLILVDIAPYAEAGLTFARECRDEDTDLVVFADEYGIARDIATPYVVTLKTKTGLILESTGGLTMALNLLLHCVATRRKSGLMERIETYRRRVTQLRLYKSG
ncbi:MurR/RpiR family transcriptional regulator [Arenibaculum sp.]|uniref:MurR/RpiR family transcriptional regulator n=1 Tax=Arenibaculum sp. TaxID=2865862 RepID=UPI002E0DD51A|nr:MurR/RpiR family transcriptional regulator [Arenibaculum sp.]